MTTKVNAFRLVVCGGELPDVRHSSEAIRQADTHFTDLVFEQNFIATVEGVHHCIVRRSYRGNAPERIECRRRPQDHFGRPIRIRSSERPAERVILRLSGDVITAVFEVTRFDRATKAVVEHLLNQDLIVEDIQISAGRDSARRVVMNYRRLTLKRRSRGAHRSRGTLERIVVLNCRRNVIRIRGGGYLASSKIVSKRSR